MSYLLRPAACIKALLACSLLGMPALATERVVSLNGSLTEIVYALKQQHRLVGVDTTSLYPSEATELPSVGYQRALSAEGVLSLQPTLILSTNHAGPATAMQQIRALGAVHAQFDESYSAASVVQKILHVATALEQRAAGEALAAALQTDMQAALAQIPADGPVPTVLFFLSMGEGAPSAAGGHTAATAIIELAGGENPFADQFQSYKPINAESLALADPDVILVSERAMQRGGGLQGVLAIPGVAQTTAAKERRIYAVDTLKTLGFGPRLAEAVATLTQHFYLTAKND